MDSQYYIDLRLNLAMNERWSRIILPLKLRPPEVQWYLCAVGLFSKPHNEWSTLQKSVARMPNLDLAQEGLKLLRRKWEEGKGYLLLANTRPSLTCSLFLPDGTKEFGEQNSAPWWSMLLRVKERETKEGGDLKPKTNGVKWKSYNEEGWIPWAWLCDLKDAEAGYDVSAGPTPAYLATSDGSLLKHHRGENLILVSIRPVHTKQTNLRPSYEIIPELSYSLDIIVAIYEAGCHPAFGIANCYDLIYEQFGKDNSAFIEAYNAAVARIGLQEGGVDEDLQCSNSTSSSGSSSLSRKDSKSYFSVHMPCLRQWLGCFPTGIRARASGTRAIYN